LLDKIKSLIIVISAPSGVGKTTLTKRLLQISSFTYSVSFTTRPPRKNEIEGVDYYFISNEEFQKMVQEEKFVEWARVHGELYGTSIDLLDNAIETKKDVVLEVDVKGGIKIKKKYPKAVLIFLLPPSWQELEKRLNKRGTEVIEKIRERIKQAKKEITYAPSYDYLVVNDNINKALSDILSIVKAERCRLDRLLFKSLFKNKLVK
jgi:guanylate kinase